MSSLGIRWLLAPPVQKEAAIGIFFHWPVTKQSRNGALPALPTQTFLLRADIFRLQNPPVCFPPIAPTLPLADPSAEKPLTDHHQIRLLAADQVSWTSFVLGQGLRT